MSETYSDLRQQAQQILQGRDISPHDLPESKDDIVRLFSELQVHQIELQLQNEELQATHRLLEQARDRYSDLYHFAPMGYFTFDRQGVIVELNLAAANLLGERRSYLAKRPFIIYLETNSHQPFGLILDRVLNNQLPQRGELTLRRRDGRRIPVKVEAIVAADNDGQLTHCRMIMLDITGQKEAQEAIIRAQKLESLAVLAGGMAHDFNNLLQVIQSQTELAYYQLTDDDPRRLHLSKALEAANLTAELTQKLLSYTGQGRLYIEELDLNELITDYINRLPAYSSQVTIVTELAPDLPLIEGDKEQIEQALTNLINNALEAINNRPGRIEVKTELITLSTEDKHVTQGWLFGDRYTNQTDFVQLSVTDNGSGMAPQTLSRIFEPFFTTKFVGRGLGLSTTLGIAYSHKGAVKAASQPQQGSSIYLLLPIQKQPDRLTQVAEKQMVIIPPSAVAQDTAVSSTIANILVIDDETAVREAITEVLHLLDEQVLSAASGEQGIDLFRQHQDEIKIVILDLSMPGLNGLETSKEIRKINPDVTIILSSGYSVEDVTTHYRTLGFAGFLQKPYTIESLLNMVKRYL